MRLAHPFSTLVLVTCFNAAAWSQSAAIPAADAAAPVPIPRHVPLPASGGVETAPLDWRQANGAVAAFPRGHADAMAWEAAQARETSQPPPAPAQAMPAGMPHHQHHGARP